MQNKNKKPKPEKLTADYKSIFPLECKSCQSQSVYYKYGRFSDMCICESCGTNLPDFKYYQHTPKSFEYKHLWCVFYGNKKPRPLLIILAGYGCDAKRTFKMSRYAKWADHYGFNLLYLADKNLYWNRTFQQSNQTIVELLTTTTYSDLFRSISDISVMGHSNGGIQMASLATRMKLKHVIFISGFVDEAVQLITQNYLDYRQLNPANTIIIDNTKDEGFTECNKMMHDYLKKMYIQSTVIEVETGHNLRACGGKMFKLLYETK